MNKLYFLGSVATLLLFSACKKDNFDPHRINEVDQQFIEQISMANRAEIFKGQMTLSKSSNPSVNAFAHALVADHSAAQQDLQQVADHLGIFLPDSMSVSQQSLIMYLSELSGFPFDTAYMQSQVIDHLQILNLVQLQFNEGNHYALKGFVIRHLDAFQYHYLKADSVRREL